ncbi:hypothetical protein HNY73_013743 [Argiope bruennichi]|uniref:RNase H type-1 domain-containing protein n=1 Tax=Argiope bruennichi TaxID=94029 RepID=A0A8T0EMW8_ARGBR|nr:hypothetical protein HNY73_013743 [Argiope bruennichi]
MYENNRKHIKTDDFVVKLIFKLYSIHPERRIIRVLVAETPRAIVAIQRDSQKISSHVGIEGNKQAGTLAKEARAAHDSPLSATALDANAVARQRFCTNQKKFSVTNYKRDIRTTIARLRTGHLRGMRLMSDGSRLYEECRHCSDGLLDPEYIFSCRFIISALFKIHIACTRDIPYSDKPEDVARAVLHDCGPI